MFLPDVRDDAKLFDFGLATEFRPLEEQSDGYKLTGDTGTVQYMAPEGENTANPPSAFDGDYTT